MAASSAVTTRDDITKNAQVAFELFDTADAGYIDRDEMSSALELLLGEAPSESVVTDLFAKIDANQDGRISLQEFTDFYFKSQPSDATETTL